ncbi:MAG: phosphate acyltransferase [bacterium]
MPTVPILNKPLIHHDQVIDRARTISSSAGMVTVAVAAAEEDDALLALERCRQEGIANALLVGRPQRIHTALDSAGIARDTFEIVPTETEEEAAATTARLAADGRAQVVMKGFLKTGILLKTILRHEYGLRDSELVSHSAVLYIPRYGKLLNITDGGTVVSPDHEQKLTILANGMTVMRAVGITRPRVAVLAPDNTAREDLPETIFAERIVRDARRRFGTSLNINGPMTLESAVTYPIVNGTEMENEVAGRADILLVHTLEEGNIIAKTLIQFGDAIFMGVIAGARVPISLVSRSDSMTNKMASIALAVCMVHSQKEERS